MPSSIVRGDFLGWAGAYSGPAFHAALADPPYLIGMMGCGWDRSSEPIELASRWGAALRRVLRPGALALLFSAPRSWHWLAVGMEQAGFEVWDTLMWMRGNGFPKGQDVGAQIDKAAGAFRPREAPDGEGGKTKNTWGDFRTKRVAEIAKQEYGTLEGAAWGGWRTPALKPGWEPILAFRLPDGRRSSDRALADGTGALNIEASRIGTAGAPRPVVGRYPANVLFDEEVADEQARRFFFCSVASPREKGDFNDHPTVKPLAVTRWLAGLLLPPPLAAPRRLLVPFAGSGSEVLGAQQVGWDEVVGVEQDEHYAEIAERRLAIA